MRLLVVSDSHGERQILKRISEKYQHDVDVMIHCGDSELRSVDPVLNGYVVVRGNCDDDERLQEDLVLEVKGNKIFITHGHMYNIKSSLLNLNYRVKELQCNFAFFGHSHLLGAELIEGTLFLNPGSISYPRGRNEKTFAIVESSDSGCKVQFINDQFEEIKPLRLEFEF